MENIKKIKFVNKENIVKSNAIDFISAGVGCNCLVILHQTGILDLLLSRGYLNTEEINGYDNPICIESALTTLRKCGVIEIKNRKFIITQFGVEITKYIGLITMVFDGYGGLISNQREIAITPPLKPDKLIRGSVVSKSAVELAKEMFNPILIEEFSKLKFSGTICDLGCGYGEMLSSICKITGNPGLGFDSEPRVVKRAKKQFRGTNIAIEQMDITDFQGVWEDVVILIQCHVFHDFTPQERCVRLMNSFIDNFPHLKCFFFLDSVAPCDNSDEILPGFDYIHGLLGKKMRTYQETITMFKNSNYTVSKEIQIDGVPNTYLWILMPNLARIKNEYHSR